ARRRSRGLAATSVAWGPWAEGGMAAGAEDQLARRGLLLLAPEQAIAMLDEAVVGGDPATVVANIAGARFVPGSPLARRSPLLTGVPEARQAIENEAAGPRQGDGGRGPLAGRLA